ncbi:MAG: hypothetical protein EON60_10620 [Alphaproteobacteria bacterium]|nr:MAG: hypothetical protein EON60_10620 [Alphaproteobacteria bacterium]
MIRRISRILVAMAAAIPLMLEPAVAMPRGSLGIPQASAAVTDVVPVGMRQCTRKIRTNCMEGKSSSRRERQRQQEADAALGAFIAGAIVLGAAAAMSNNNGYYRDHGSYNRSYSGRNYHRSNNRGGGRQQAVRGGSNCKTFVETPNPRSGVRCQ